MSDTMNTPWTPEGSDEGWMVDCDHSATLGYASFHDAEGRLVGFTVTTGFDDRDSDLRAFIVRAVNSHQALVEALQAIRDGLRSDGRVWVDNGSGSREAGPDLRSFIDAALAECAKPLSEVA